MATVQYTAEVKGSRILELPVEAEQLHLKPGDRVQVQLHHSDRDVAIVAPNEPKRPSALGKYAFVPGGSEEFARAKQAEIEREDRAGLP